MQASAVHGSSKYARSASLALQQPAQAARAELMDGAVLQPTRPAYKEAMDNKQLMSYAVDTHKETTESAKRALKVKGRRFRALGCAFAAWSAAPDACVGVWCVGAQTIESAKQVQAATLDNLRDQGQQMERIERDLDQVRGSLAGGDALLGGGGGARVACQLGRDRLGRRRGARHRRDAMTHGLASRGRAQSPAHAPPAPPAPACCSPRPSCHPTPPLGPGLAAWQRADLQPARAAGYAGVLLRGHLLSRHG